MPASASRRVSAVALLLCALLCADDLVAAADRAIGFPIVATYSVTEIGRSGKSWAVTQDNDGVMYFGRNGLTTFDGERWHTWPMNEGYAVRGLEFGPDGKLWVAGNGAVGWFERDDLKWKFRSLMDHLPAEARRLGELWHVFADDHGGAVFVADHTLLHWNGSAFHTWSLPGDRRLNAFRSGGRIYVHQPTTGIHEVTTEGPRVILPAAAIGDARIWWLQMRGDEWTFLTSDGFFKLANGNRVPFAPDTNIAIKRAIPSCLLDLHDGRLAIGTVSGGVLLAREDGTLEHVFDETNGLPTTLVNGLFLDRDRQLWVTSNSSIDRVSLSSRSVVFDRRATLPEKPILNIVSHRGTIMASTEASIFQLQNDGRTFAVHTDNELISDLMSASEGLVSTGFLNVKLTTNGGTTLVRAAQSDVFLIEPARFRPGEYFLSEGTRIMSLDATDGARPIVEGLPGPVTSLAEDAEGRLWLSSYRQGVLFLDPRAPPGGDRRPPASVGLPPLRGQTVIGGTKDGTVFVFSTAGGWALAPRATAFAPIERFPHRTVTAVSRTHVSEDSWVGFDAADGRPATIGRIAIEKGRPTWQPHEVEGLHAIATPRSILPHTESDGRRVLWIGGTRGLLRNIIAAGPTALAPRPPLVRAIAFSARDGARETVRAPLPYSTPRLQFEFAAPEFARRSSLRLESFIEGIDGDWVPVGPDSRRELAAMRDGDYRIHVRTVADTGTASVPTSFSFQVLPPWWRTPSAAIGLIVMLLPTVVVSVRLRLRALRRRNAELEEKVRVRTEELVAASAAKTQFVANMSHDIRNPLNGIVGLTLALEDSRLDTRQREIVATLRECTTYLSTLVDDVLDFASIEAGRVELRPGPFVPRELLTSIVTTLKGDTAERGATFTCTTDPRLPGLLLGDAGRIQQILVNFASNALKYAGGHIHLEASCPEDASGEVEFAVTDRGRGISPEEQATLFTKFTRLERSRHDDIPGAGLGLAACRLLADIMGGGVGVESRVGEGARFFLRLPLTIAREAPEPAPASLPNTTVLLVEDTDYNAWAATAVLSRLGLTCDRARTGEEAVRMFNEKRYNVVLLDRNLPDMDGTEVARRIRKMESDGLPAILLAVTAYCTAEDRTLCLEAGMDAFVGKPLTPDKLRRVLLTTGRRMLAAATVDVPRETVAAEVDLTLLNYLSNGTEASFADHVERFLATMSETEADLATTLAAGEFSALEVHAHRVLGQAKMVGAATLAEAALQLEHAAKSHDAVVCRKNLRRVRDEMRMVTAAMRRPRPAMSTV